MLSQSTPILHDTEVLLKTEVIDIEKSETRQTYFHFKKIRVTSTNLSPLARSI